MVDCLDNKTKLFALRVIKLSRYLMEEKKRVYPFQADFA